MTNLEWFKLKWIQTIWKLSEEEVYGMLTDGTVNAGICKCCEMIFPPCEDNLENDELCRERFKVICGMDHQDFEKRKELEQ